MVREDIVYGLKNALTRGQSLESANRSFISAWYDIADVEEASKSLNLGAITSIPDLDSNKPQNNNQNPPSTLYSQQPKALQVTQEYSPQVQQQNQPAPQQTKPTTLQNQPTEPQQTQTTNNQSSFPLLPSENKNQAQTKTVQQTLPTSNNQVPIQQNQQAQQQKNYPPLPTQFNIEKPKKKFPKILIILIVILILLVAGIITISLIGPKILDALFKK